MIRGIYVVLTTIFFFQPFNIRAQSVNEVVEKYNHSIDPNGKLDSIIQIQVDMNQKSFSLSSNLIADENFTLTYSINGESYSVNWISEKRIDLNPFDLSSLETKHIIKTHFNILTHNDQENFDFIEANDSIFVVKKFSDDKEVFYEIARPNYDLIKRITRYNGNETTLTFSEFEMIDGLKVPTSMSLSSEIGFAETNML
ncbi:MAG: hypothetical protein RIB63_04870 [Fulvivirga sp.]